MGWLAGNRITAERLRDNAQNTVSYDSLTTNSGTFTTTETIVLTTQTVEFRNDRAYRVSIRLLANSSVAGDRLTVRVRETDATGTAYIDQEVIYLPTTGNQPTNAAQIVANATGSDINQVLVLTGQRISGTGNITIAASTNNVAYIQVEDIGDASDYPGARAVTV